MILLMLAFAFFMFKNINMNSKALQPPNINFPPTTNDIENMQFYISTLETALVDGHNVERDLQTYGEHLMQLSASLIQSNYYRQSETIQDLAGLAMNALAE